MLLDRLSVSAPLDKPIILHLLVAYRSVIARNPLGILEGRLVYYEPITTIINHICHIVVPTSLRRIIFNLMYAAPVAGNMGEYKTIYHIRLIFSWPRLRSDVAEWMKQCAHCMLTYCSRHCGQKSMFSWPVRSHFSIIYVNLSMPGHYSDPNDYIALMNDMYDMSQFVVVVPVPDKSTATLTS